VPASFGLIIPPPIVRYATQTSVAAHVSPPQLPEPASFAPFPPEPPPAPPEPEVPPELDDASAAPEPPPPVPEDAPPVAPPKPPVLDEPPPPVFLPPVPVDLPPDDVPFPPEATLASGAPPEAPELTPLSEPLQALAERAPTNVNAKDRFMSTSKQSSYPAQPRGTARFECATCASERMPRLRRRSLHR